MRWIMRSKIHKAICTEANLNYVGSITIDEDLIIQQAVDSIMAIPKVNENQQKIDALQKQIDSLKAQSN